MSPALRQYLRQAYQRDVMHQHHTAVRAAPMAADPGLVAEIKAELARIDGMRLGANLAQRAFVDYQNRKVLLELLGRLETTATLATTEVGKDTTTITGT